MSHMIELHKVSKYYTNKDTVSTGLSRVDLTFDMGEFVAITGESGSGKSTLLNVISGLDTYEEGEMFVGGQDTSAFKTEEYERYRKNFIGNIFQDFNLLDNLTAYENIALALSIQNVNSAEIEHRVKKVAEDLDIQNILQKYPYQMSGGQKQRVASARAIITNPKLVLADEPTGALDSKSSRMLLERLDYLNQELGATILMVTHDAFTASYSSRVIFIKDGKIFNEINRGKDSRKEFFDKIIDVMTLLGGDLGDAL